MLTVTNNPILHPFQIQILQEFFSHSSTSSFFLTGGTALSAFYFAHRESNDLDLFSIDSFDMQEVSFLIKTIGDQLGCDITTAVATPTYTEIYLTRKDKSWSQRIDIVREQPRRFENISLIDGIRVDSLENIGSKKILAIFGRLEGKDYIDLFFILRKSSVSFQELFSLAKQKDSGLSEFYFANVVRNVHNIKIWPRMKQAIDIKTIADFYDQLSVDMLLSIKP
ncbi:MAG: nucleotidyl transferase AbiEii/AbiGii toxin family protein [Patescibacteria group bacterium]|nr:nucleotidyl transferase AbiEii/AbiGii toxin family protein [Patescibacteria group bacterium]